MLFFPSYKILGSNRPVHDVARPTGDSMFDIKLVGRKISLGTERLLAPAKSASYIRLALSVALFSAFAWPQTQLATVFGNITDPTGAVIAEAQVTVSSKSTGLKRVALTDITGQYHLAGLPPGMYTVRAEKENFRRR